MFKNLLVALEESSIALTPYAVSLAKRLKAQVTVVRPRRDETLMTDGSLAARYEFAVGENEAREVRARESLEAFAATARAEGVEVEIIAPDDPQDPRRDQLAEFARAFDFVVVSQAEPGRPPTAEDFAGALLAESGRPVVVVPAIQREPASFAHILVAWDASAAAARAFGDAAPIFEQAAKVEIIAVTGSKISRALHHGGQRLAGRLARGGIAAEFKRLPSDEDPANALLSYAADSGADLMVAGGYGHSRIREALFGGVTRTLLSSQTLPLFLSR
jgi:nucleotide-binding universal stress UspA family protein